MTTESVLAPETSPPAHAETVSIVQSGTQYSAANHRSQAKLWNWQNKLMVFMAAMIAGVTAAFLLGSYIQLSDIYHQVLVVTPLNFNTGGNTAVVSGGQAGGSPTALQVTGMNPYAALEFSVMDHRYHQANALLVAAIWSNYLGLVTGMILALVGATFILGMLDSGLTSIDSGNSVWHLVLTSSSPGLIMLVLGVVLMMATMFIKQDIAVTDKPVYMATNLPEGGMVTEQTIGIPPVIKPSATAADVPSTPAPGDH